MSTPATLISDDLLDDNVAKHSCAVDASGLDSIANAAAVAHASNPTDIDVIFGRGEPTRTHPGNIVLRKLVHKYLEAYMNSSKSEKTSIIRRLIREIDDSGARYLVPLDTSCRQTIFTGGCREARKSEVRSKVSHAFRDGERRALLQRERDAVLANSLSTAESGEFTQGLAGGAPATISPVADAPFVQNVEARPDLPLSRLTSSTLVPSSTDRLLSFATILTSMGHPSYGGQQQPPPASINRMEALSTLASSSLSAYEHRQKAQKAPSTKMGRGVTTTTPTHKPSAANKASAAKTQQVTSSISASLEKYCQKADVVFGRGAPLRQHPGNVTFRKTVAKFSDQYVDGTKHLKTDIIQNVIRELQEAGARFLIMNDQGSGVTEATQDEIRMKVSHRFRDFPKSNGSKSPTPTKKEHRAKTKSSHRPTPLEGTMKPVEQTRSMVIGV